MRRRGIWAGDMPGGRREAVLLLRAESGGNEEDASSP
jgi:hypothetical protein